MSIQRVIAAALELQERLLEIGLPYCFIGGIAVQRWGEPRLTVDADATVLSDWEHDERLADALLATFSGRLVDSREFALRHRVLLLSGSDGTPLDVALGAIPFEHRSVERGSHWHLPAGRSLLTCSAEDLIVHKAFASRDRDWVDIDGVLVRQGLVLDTALILEELRPLAALKEEPGIVTRLEALLRKRAELPNP
jgi:hypothetical protein